MRPVHRFIAATLIILGAVVCGCVLLGLVLGGAGVGLLAGCETEKESCSSVKDRKSDAISCVEG